MENIFTTLQPTGLLVEWSTDEGDLLNLSTIETITSSNLLRWIKTTVIEKMFVGIQFSRINNIDKENCKEIL